MDASAPAHDEPRRIGTTLAGRYRIASVVGVGAMGTVYRADDLRVGAPVAVKILRPHLGDSEEAIARFRREALVGSRIDHPNCVGVWEVGTCDDGAIYLVMELLDGECLTDLLARERRIPWRRALHLVRHVLRGLASAHARGVVHRDLKPDNVVVGQRDGDPDFARVLDFGIAKLTGAAVGPAITQAGLTVGTPEYLSPEQAVGGELDGRSDVYSVSVVLYQLLTGRTPFADPDLVEVLTAHATAPVPAFAAVAPDVDLPAAVEALVRDGLAKRPDDRIPSAAAYVARIDELLAPAEAAAASPAGTIVDGRYRLEAVLGRGAMGHVYRATHVGLGRTVAIKVLDRLLASDEAPRRRFEREALATARLGHPNCVGVTDVGTMPDGSPYLVMELIAGRSLDAVLGDEPRLPLDRALHVLRHVLRGLAHAHAQGLVHRDLKPGNIMIVPEGDDRELAKILDFGLARAVGGDEDRITSTGIVCGTPTYMAPEQVLDRELDPRTDLYAASVIAFEMLAGRPPFAADETMAVLQMHLKAEVPRIADVAPDVVVPPAIEDLVRRGLAKRPDERPASAVTYLAELDRACAPPSTAVDRPGLDAAIPATPAPPPSRLTRAWTRRRLAIPGAIAGAVLAVGIIAAVASPDPSVTTAAPTTDAGAAPPAPDIEMPAEPARVDPDIARALELAHDGRGEEAVASLRALRLQRPDDAQIPYTLGRVYHRLGWSKPTLDAYRDALRQDPSLRDDPSLIADVVSLLGSKSVWQRASRMLLTDIGPSAVPEVTATAQQHPDATVRGRAARIRDKLAAAPP